MLKKNDLILIGAVVLLCLAVIFLTNLTKKEGSRVVIMVDNKVYATLDLNKDTTYAVKGKNGSYNTFVIKDGYVDMIDASCPDKVCVHHRSIHYNNETIVCLPNKVVLNIIASEDSEVDMIAN